VQSTVGLILSVALISLMIIDVGNMSIMRVSVTDRSREIGLRMAVGASPKNTLRHCSSRPQGFPSAEGSSLLVHWPTKSSFLAILGSVSVSTTAEIMVRYNPAWKASRLNPIEVFRYD